MLNKKGIPMTEDTTVTTALVEQIIKDNPGATVKEIAWKISGSDTPSEEVRREVAAKAFSLTTRAENQYVRQGHKYYAPTASQERQEASQPLKVENPPKLDLEPILRDYAWETGADVKPLHDLLDWYETQS
jgi:hypothetical protein